MDTNILIGCDFHSRSQNVAMLNQETGEVTERRLTHPEEAEAFYRSLPLGCVVGIETGSPSHWFERLLRSCGHTLWVGHATKISRSAPPGRKNDKLDAAHLLELLRSKHFPKVWWPDEEVRERRCLVAHRHGLVKMRTRLVLQLRSIGRDYGVIGKCRFTAAYRRELEKLPLAPYAANRRRVLLGLFDAVAEEIRAVDPQIGAMAKEDPASQRLMTHPGVGPVTALYLPLVIGDPDRFANGDALANYLGLIPSEHSSAERRSQGGILKQGNRMARWLLVEAGQMAARMDPELKRFYGRLAHRRGRQRAKVAVARKLAIRLLLMLKREMDYQEWIACPARTQAGPGGRIAIQG